MATMFVTCDVDRKHFAALAEWLVAHGGDWLRATSKGDLLRLELEAKAAELGGRVSWSAATDAEIRLAPEGEVTP